MVKLIVITFYILVSIYLLGEKVRLNPKIDKFFDEIEGHYTKLNKKLEETTVINGLKFFCRMYGWLSAFLYILVFIMRNFLQNHKLIIVLLFTSAVFCFFGWLSLKWALEYQSNDFIKFIKKNLIIIFGPLLLGFIDLMIATQIMREIFLPLVNLLSSVDIHIPQINNPIYIGCILSSSLFIFFILSYFMAWVITIPILLFSIFIIIVPIKFARLLSRIDHENTFFWFAVVLWGILTYTSSLI